MTIFALTAPGVNYPAYVNASLAADGESVSLTVRSKVGEEGKCGDTAFIELTESEAHQLAWALLGPVGSRLGRFREERDQLIKAAGVEGRAESVEAADAIEKIKGWRTAISALYTAMRL